MARHVEIFELFSHAKALSQLARQYVPLFEPGGVSPSPSNHSNPVKNILTWQRCLCRAGSALQPQGSPALLSHARVEHVTRLRWFEDQLIQKLFGLKEHWLLQKRGKHSTRGYYTSSERSSPLEIYTEERQRSHFVSRHRPSYFFRKRCLMKKA
jgi:hypothetical protein